MQLKTWRKLKSKTLADVAADLGIEGINPSRTIHRHESGETRVDVPLADAYAKLTDGAVTFADFHEARRAFLADADNREAHAARRRASRDQVAA